MQPGQSVYWNGFGDPPSLSFRADFDDIAFNRGRQEERELIKGRFCGGNIGWIESADLELFACLFRRPVDRFGDSQARLLELIRREGPLTIQQMKEETGLLVKEITPALHRLQEAFLIYEDQYDGGWDRGWYAFEEMFPDADLDKFTRIEALKLVLRRFAYRNAVLDVDSAKSFYRLPGKDIKAAAGELVFEGALISGGDGWLLTSDAELLKSYEPREPHFVRALHRNDFLCKSSERLLKEKFAGWKAAAERSTGLLLPYDADPRDCEPLQYLLIDGEFHGASVGHFRNGPYDLNDVFCDLPDAEKRFGEIVQAVKEVNGGRSPKRFMGKEI